MISWKMFDVVYTCFRLCINLVSLQWRLVMMCARELETAPQSPTLRMDYLLRSKNNVVLRSWCNLLCLFHYDKCLMKNVQIYDIFLLGKNILQFSAFLESGPKDIKFNVQTRFSYFGLQCLPPLVFKHKWCMCCSCVLRWARFDRINILHPRLPLFVFNIIPPSVNSVSWLLPLE